MSAEQTFITAMQAIARDPAARGLRDDAAVLQVGGETLILTHDAMAEGVHWLPGQDPADVAWKLAAANLSDLAAKGAQPLGLLLGFVLGDAAWDRAFAAGLSAALEHFDVPLLGGDTVAAPARVLGMTAVGRATHVPVPGRNGARVGDGIYLSGPIGGAMVGYELVRDGKRGECSAFTRPEPALGQGVALAPHVTAMMDVSDGLLLDAHRMASASEVTFEIDSAAVPLAAPEARRHDALRWGDDYVLLFTASANCELPVSAHHIGTVPAPGAAPLSLDGAPQTDIAALGYQHG